MRWLLVVICCVGCQPVSEPRTQTRARVEAEPAGENCAEGGLVINSGVDSDDDQEVDDDEITAINYLCNFEKTLECDDQGKVLHGIVTVATSEDEARVDGVTCIDGDLVIANSDTLEILGLSRLEMVTGHVIVAGNPQLATLDGVDLISTVGGTYLVQGNDLLADLTAIGARLSRGDLSIVANRHMPDLAGLDAMTRAPGAIVIADNPELDSLFGLDQLATSAYPITIRSNPALTSLASLGKLAAAGALELSGNRLSTIELPALSTVAGRLAIEHEGAARTIALPSLASARSITVASNASLTDIQLPALRELGGLFVTDDRALARVAASALSVAERVQLANLAALRAVELTGLELVNDISIESCALTDFTGFGLVDVAGAFTAKRNMALTSIKGLEKLEHVGGSFTFETGSETVRAEVKAFAERIDIGGTVTIE